ncbi:MAG: MFS transporter [Caldilineaceae bacterium]
MTKWQEDKLQMSRLVLHRLRENWAAPLDHSIEQMSSQPLTNERLRGLRFFWFDGLFAAGSEAFFLNYTALFAVAFGATNGQIGLLTALANLAGAIALFPGAQLLESVGKRRSIVVWTGGGLGRIGLFLIAIMPFFVKDSFRAVVAIIAFNCIRNFMNNLANPAWTGLVADIIPKSMRGRYLSSRNFAMGLATLCITPLAGWLITSGEAWTSNSLLGYQMTYLLAFGVGMLSTASFQRIEETEMVATQTIAQSRAGMFQLLRENRAFMGFVVSAFVFNLALQIAGPFFNVYMKSGLGATETQVGLAASISSLAALVGQLLWGRLLDRKGSVWIQVVSGFLIPIMPVLWIFYSRPEQVYVNNIFGGFMWAGYNLSNFNLLLSLTPDHDRPRATALYQTVVFTSAVIGPLIGGWIADLVSFNLIFVISGVGRLLGMILFVLMCVPVIHREKIVVS